jgi:hypothetical protein
VDKTLQRLVTRLGLFTTTAQRLGTTPQNVEKNFRVCWTLDALFRPARGRDDSQKMACRIVADHDTGHGR